MFVPNVFVKPPVPPSEAEIRLTPPFPLIPPVMLKTPLPAIVPFVKTAPTWVLVIEAAILNIPFVIKTLFPLFPSALLFEEINVPPVI